jgi:signal peptidase I
MSWPIRILALVFLLSAVAITLAIGPFGGIFYAANQGMAPGIAKGDRIYMDRLAYLTTGPVRGDVVCFRGEGMPTLVHTEEWQVKRVVGLPGDTVSVRDGKLYVGENPAPEVARFHYILMDFDNYLTDGTSFTVPPGNYFLLGDNPDGSYDSRFYGPVPLDKIKGRAILRLWPFSRAGGLK